MPPQIPKLRVEGSIPFTRSNNSKGSGISKRCRIFYCLGITLIVTILLKSDSKML